MILGFPQIDVIVSSEEMHHVYPHPLRNFDFVRNGSTLTGDEMETSSNLTSEAISPAPNRSAKLAADALFTPRLFELASVFLSRSPHCNPLMRRKSLQTRASRSSCMWGPFSESAAGCEVRQFQGSRLDRYRIVQFGRLWYSFAARSTH
ncbi:hypothetical protein CPB85DRAFT_183950 [Mucidula mucida]|nr:hypothetical protein CPB85DRAFT_183950 [Mucidula mucida]